MGEFEIGTTSDGQHEDVGIARIHQHEKWNKDLMINDIAIVLLERDVQFNGRSNHIHIFAPNYYIQVWLEFMTFVSFQK